MQKLLGKPWWSGLILGWMFSTGCLDTEPVEPFNIDEATQLLSLGATKAWKIVSREENGIALTIPECYLQNRQIFNVTGTDGQLDEVGALLTCTTPAADTISSFFWEASFNLRDEFTDTLFLTNRNDIDESDIRVVELLTFRQLRWRFLQNDDQGNPVQVREVYTFED